MGVALPGLASSCFKLLGSGVLVLGVFSALGKGVVFARVRFVKAACGVAAGPIAAPSSSCFAFDLAGVLDAAVDVLAPESLPGSVHKPAEAAALNAARLFAAACTAVCATCPVYAQAQILILILIQIISLLILVFRG